MNDSVRITNGDGDTLFEGSTDDLHRAAENARRIPMKETEEDRAESDLVYGIAADELRAFVERIERLQSEMRDLKEDEKEVFAELKGRGYDAKIVRKVIALRKRQPDDIEEEAVLEMYKEALGMR